jgi:RNA polymerase sigma factor (sigma-70 family)
MARGNEDLLAQIRRVVFPPGTAETNDGQLLTRFVESRDVEAAAALVRRHGPMVWGVCRRLLGHAQDAEDAFQATFLVFVRKAATVKPREMIGNWLYGVAQQTARKARMTADRHRLRERPCAAVPDVPADAEQRGDAAAALDCELSRLPDIYRTAIVLCDLGGMTRPQAARQLGVPDGTLAARLFRGREMLAKRLARHGFGATAVSVALSASASAAPIPGGLLATTTRAVGLLAVNPAALHTVPLSIRILTNGVLNAMLLSKLKSVCTTLILVGLLTCGGWIYRDAFAAQGPQPTPPAKGEAVPKKGIEALRGKWSAESIQTWQGNSNKNLKIVKVDANGFWTIFDGEKMVRPGTGADGKPEHHTFKLTFEENKDPPRFTMHIKKGNEAWRIRYIYEVKGDTLRMCCFGVTEVNGVEVVEFPTKFSLDEDPANPRFPRLEVWKRDKEKE